MNDYSAALGARGQEALERWLQDYPADRANVRPRWQPLGRRITLSSGGQVSTTFRPKGAPFCALWVGASFDSSAAADHAGLVRVEMRGASRAGYILGDETEPLPLPALVSSAHGLMPVSPARWFLQDEEYTATLSADTLAGTSLVALYFHGFYLR